MRSLKNVGRTSLFGRSVQLAAPRSLDDLDNAVSDSFNSIGLTTGHFEQRDIAGMFDVRFAYALAPEPFVHELRVGFHGPEAGDPGSLIDNPLNLFRANLGLVELPALPFYGVEGGRTWSFDVRIGSPNVYIAVERNTPELLVIFPYAYDATSFQLKFSFDDSFGTASN